MTGIHASADASPTTKTSNLTALVSIPAPEKREFTVLEGEIRLRHLHVRRLEGEIAPLITALETFEWEYKARLGGLQQELRNLLDTIELLESRSTRIHARLAADPGGVLGDLFSPAELREIGDMFGIDIPPSWFGANEEDERQDHERDWQYFGGTSHNQAEEEKILRRLQKQHRPHLSKDDRSALKSLYIRLARLCHPDLATDDDDRHRRQELMLRINDAWHTGNLHAMQEIERDRGAALGWRALTSWAERVIWARRECVRLDGQIIGLTERLHALRSSDTFPLWFNPSLGNSVITQRATTLRIDIANAHHRLDEARDGFRQALQYYAAAVA